MCLKRTCLLYRWLKWSFINHIDEIYTLIDFFCLLFSQLLRERLNSSTSVDLSTFSYSSVHFCFVYFEAIMIINIKLLHFTDELNHYSDTQLNSRKAFSLEVCFVWYLYSYSTFIFLEFSWVVFSYHLNYLYWQYYGV